MTLEMENLKHEVIIYTRFTIWTNIKRDSFVTFLFFFFYTVATSDTSMH